MIYGVSPSVQQKEMNTQDEEDEEVTLKRFSKLRNIRNYIRRFLTNQCLRVKN